MRATAGHARTALHERLEHRREEIEAAALARAAAISDPAEVSDPAYAEGLRRAIPAAIDFGIETIDSGEGHEPPIPVDLLAQARLAARNGIALDTVLRRYFAGYSLLGYFILEEAAQAGFTGGADLKRLLATHAGIFDRLLAAISEEHAREVEARALFTTERRRAERIERLLAGEQVDTREIPYDFEGWHVGVVAIGTGATETVRGLAEVRDCGLLSVPREGDVLWAWLGTRRGPGALELDRVGATPVPEGTSLALGEPGRGQAGWRLTHRQAVAALPVARCGTKPIVRHTDVALVAAALRDEALAASLRDVYLEPLAGGRDGGRALRETLRAYLASGGRITSAAATLGVQRHTVTSRLRAVEKRVGRRIHNCATEIDVALRLAELDEAKLADET